MAKRNAQTRLKKWVESIVNMLEVQSFFFNNEWLLGYFGKNDANIFTNNPNGEELHC